MGLLPARIRCVVGSSFAARETRKDDLFPTSPALRIDGEIGLGGAALRLILHTVNDIFVVSLKAVRMRTWLLTLNEGTNRTFNGGVVDLRYQACTAAPK